EHDHYAAHFLLVLTSLCAAASWLSAMAGSRSYEPDLHSLNKFLRIWGLPLTVCLFVFSLSGTWAGLARPGDFNSDSIGGLIPFSDANGYFSGSLSVGCFVEALRRRSLQFALLGLAFTFMALMTRMGAMFLLPAVMLWILCCFGESWRKKIYIAAAMIGIVTAGLATNFTLQ